MNTDILLQAAYDHHRASRYSEAIQNYQAAIQLDLNLANAHYDLHLAYRDIGHLQSAFQELQVAAILLPGDKDVYAAKRYLYDVLGAEENLPILEDVVNHLPDDAGDRQILLGVLAHRHKDYRKATVHFENALQEQPDITYIQGYLGRALLFESRYADAQKMLTLATRDETAKSRDLYNLGVAEVRLRHYAAAVHNFERAVEIDKTYQKAWLALTKTEWRRGHWRSAWKSFWLTVKSHPEMQADHSN